MQSISVCMATYNGARFLNEQIDSILAQLGPEDELLVSDDGSTDTTLELIEAYGPRLRIVGSGRAGGVVRNFERVLYAAKGNLIALSDQDDVWLDGRLDLVRERLRIVSMLMMNGEVVDAKLKPTGQDIYQFVGSHRGFGRTLISTTYVGCCMAFRREVLEIALPFPKRILWHDWYLALISELLFKCEHHPQKAILFRRHEDNASTTGQASRASIQKKIQSRVWMTYAVLIALSRHLFRQFKLRHKYFND